MSARVAPEFLIEVAQQCLGSGTRKKQRLRPSACLSLAAQVLAVDVGLRPSFLYDANTAGPEQLRLYLRKLREAGFLSHVLNVLAVDGNVVIVNEDLTVLHMEELLLKNTVAVIDVSQSRAQPALAGPESRVRELTQTVVDDFKLGTLVEWARSPWNFCTLFGVLLGFPATYWFDQERSFENCLSMTPLRVTTVCARCRAIAKDFRVQLCSFSIPEILTSATRAEMDNWTGKMLDRFSRQAAFTDLHISSKTVSLPSVTL
nr:PREDICTED: UPF0739 protein C1orf74 homolog [Lepisosteus oculatus]XP_015198284.1 PREDICTED: UPF0739 protein C1orf74 homolog [Lepisosteus oculatus]XP_015198285.1 PREDICTED: UPF0739 protein C1orf74 homolog [Lepisosteus oculatus]